MLSENVDKVLQAEADVSELFSKTEDCNERAQKEAHAAAKALIEQKTAEAKTYAAKLLADAEEKSRGIYAEYEEQAQERIAVMNAEAQARVPAAVQTVKDTILG
ncbi:MAG: hypothetical protein IJL26_13615 [Clostridia bacterium]|nr:hypothetical protein [Clostridia bacterium]